MHSCRSLIAFSLKNPNPFSLYKPQISLSFSLFFSSSSSSRQHPISVADYLLRRLQFSPETISKLPSPDKYLKNPEKSDSLISFLEENSFSRTQIEQVIKRRPAILFANTDRTIKPKIKFFQELGLSPTDIARIISADPWILTKSVNNRLGPSILALKSILGSISDVFEVLKHSGWVLKYNLEKTLIPNLEFLKTCGISSSQLVKYVSNNPTFFCLKPQSIKECVKRVDAMGFSKESKNFLHAIRVIRCLTVEKWEHKLELFRSLGFSEDDIIVVFRRMPVVFMVSEKKIKEVTQILLNNGKIDISNITNHPRFLTYSVENRLKPRLRVLEVLESKNLATRELSLRRVCGFTDKEFFEKCVLPYSNEVGNIYPSVMRATRQPKCVVG